jgi:hypothetical protein
MDEKKKANTCCDDYVLMFVYVDSISVKHSNSNFFKVRNGKYALFIVLCEFMWRKKTNCLGF